LPLPVRAFFRKIVRRDVKKIKNNPIKYAKSQKVQPSRLEKKYPVADRWAIFFTD
jgi:hypothetical protein